MDPVNPNMVAQGLGGTTTPAGRPLGRYRAPPPVSGSSFASASARPQLPPGMQMERMSRDMGQGRPPPPGPPPFNGGANPGQFSGMNAVADARFRKQYGEAPPGQQAPPPMYRGQMGGGPIGQLAGQMQGPPGTRMGQAQGPRTVQMMQPAAPPPPTPGYKGRVETPNYGSPAADFGASDPNLARQPLSPPPGM